MTEAAQYRKIFHKASQNQRPTVIKKDKTINMILSFVISNGLWPY